MAGRMLQQEVSEQIIEVPYLVVGAGIAGLVLALRLARHGKVLVLAKGGRTESNTWFAQGGIASVLDHTDSFNEHITDTLTAGAGLCHEQVVRMVVESGPEAIKELIDLGVQFTLDDSRRFEEMPYHLTREGGHSKRRVAHVRDATGKAVLTALYARVVEHPDIQIVENQLAIDLLTTDRYAPNFAENRCLGAYVLCRKSSRIYQVRSQETFLCTGGHGKIYLYTSNPDSATGDGVAMAWRAGCKVGNLEFMQFHPTCLYHPKAKSLLISEAVRGEGGILKDFDGKPFMEGYHPMGSLAPRDIVARAIDAEIKRSGHPHVYLDVRHLGAESINTLFPNIQEECRRYGIEMSQDLIPVVPAAHYSCGGIIVDDCGRTSVRNLFAIGENACSGLHGANRLASNSLLEAVVFARRAAEFVATNPSPDVPTIQVPAWDVGKAVPQDELVVLTHTWDEIRRLMWNYVGIVRTEKRLKRALNRIEAIRRELESFYWDYEISDNLIEVRNLAVVAWLTVRCAMVRKESRGIHFTLDYPSSQPERRVRDTVIW
jgi:L-aspartate oxidase